MANWVLSECGLRPLPKVYSTPRTGVSQSQAAKFVHGGGSNPRRPSLWVSACSGREKKWEVKVSTPLTVPIVGGEERVNGIDGIDGFDPAAPPPFKLADIRAAIPKHCWVKDPWRSMSYVVRDVAVVFGLAAVAAYFNNLAVWPLYWFAQGTMFWALFVLGHDYGHGSFSNNPKLNSVVGHLLHSSILVPYHGWRISHRTHHQNHGHVENDESWHPLPEKIYKKLDNVTKKLRFTLPFPLLANPIYLWSRSPGKSGSHFDPNSDLFVPNERKDIITSTACWSAMAALLVGLSFVMGPIQVLKLYGVPYLLFVMWLDLVTYLHHHGHEDKLLWYQGKFSGSSFASSKPRKLQVSLPVTASHSRQFKRAKLGQQRLFVAENDHITTNVHTHASGNSEMPSSPSLDVKNDEILPKPSPSTSSGPILEGKDTPSSSPDVRQKRTSLTAREKLRAARVLSRYNESKTSTRKAGMGSKLLDVLKESEKGKKGLPEAPTNMLDDSKRGMPKAGLTFSFPGGFDLFLIIFSFVFISTVMFATTYIVWKLGAIHFNEN